jgi:hypothetical protein
MALERKQIELAYREVMSAASAAEESHRRLVGALAVLQAALASADIVGDLKVEGAIGDEG